MSEASGQKHLGIIWRLESAVTKSIELDVEMMTPGIRDRYRIALDKIENRKIIGSSVND